MWDIVEPPRDVLHEPVALELPQRLAHGRLAHRQLARERGFVDREPRRKIAADDAFPEALVDLDLLVLDHLC
jgi:hypothetical protein